MFTSPRVVAIDDIPGHLQALVNGLHQQGVGCLPIQYPDDLGNLTSCPNLRVLFADLHLTDGGTSEDSAVHLNAIGGLIEEVLKPLGPYFVVLWTRYPEQADALMVHLETELKGVATPFSVFPLDKGKYYNASDELDSEKLIKDIASLSDMYPQLSALLDWEDHVLGAAGDTVASVLDLARDEQDKEARKTRVSRLLYKLAEAAVGEQHVGDNRFHAVNEALLPVLADRMAFLESRSGNALWQEAFDPQVHNQNLSSQEISRLNRMVHIASPSVEINGSVRGAVVNLPMRFVGWHFIEEFAMQEARLAGEEFFCRAFQKSDPQFRWILVQAQPACDYALSRPGTTPFYLGLDLPAQQQGTGRARESLWRSPRYDYNGVERLLHVSARFPVALSSYEARGMRPIYRLREQILENLIQHLHSYGSRLGIMAFR